MESSESRSLDWKICFKKILTPHLLNPSNSEELSDTCPKYDSVTSIKFLNDPKRSENVGKGFHSSNTAESAHKDSNSQQFVDSFVRQCRNSDFPDILLNDSENPVETGKNVRNPIATDAEEVAKNFRKLSFKKKKNKYFNMAESNRKAPEWNLAFKKILDPKSVPESSSKNLEEIIDKGAYLSGPGMNRKLYLSHPELLDSSETNPWTYHRLCKDETLGDDMEESLASVEDNEKCRSERHYTEEEKGILEILQSAGYFKLPEKPHMNIFDGAGINCFKESEIKSSTKYTSSNTKKPINAPPPGGWVCIKPVTVEDAMNRPPNVIFSECWDYEDEW